MVNLGESEFVLDFVWGGSQLSLRYHARRFEQQKNLTEIIREIHLTEIVKFQTCQTTLPTPQNPFLAGGLN